MTQSTAASTSRNSVLVGPSGRALAEPIAEDLLNGLQHHLNMERQAHANYFAAAVWFAERELRGFARYFRKNHKANTDMLHNLLST